MTGRNISVRATGKAARQGSRAWYYQATRGPSRVRGEA